MDGEGFEPPTLGSSGRRSTNWATRPVYIKGVLLHQNMRLVTTCMRHPITIFPGCWLFVRTRLILWDRTSVLDGSRVLGQLFKGWLLPSLPTPNHSTPWQIRTADPLRVKQMLWTNWAKGAFKINLLSVIYIRFNYTTATRVIRIYPLPDCLHFCSAPRLILVDTVGLEPNLPHCKCSALAI